MSYTVEQFEKTWSGRLGILILHNVLCSPVPRSRKPGRREIQTTNELIKAKTYIVLHVAGARS